MSQTALCLSTLSKGYLVGATSLVLQQQLSQNFEAVEWVPCVVAVDGACCS